MPFNVAKLLSNLIMIVSILFIVFAIYFLIKIGNKKVSENERIIFHPKQIKRNIVVILLTLFGIYLFYKYGVIGDTIVTIIVSIIIAYILNPVVMKLENKGLNRTIAILLVYVIIIAVIGTLATLVVPKSLEQIKTFAYHFPQVFQNTVKKITEFGDEFFKNNPFISSISENVLSEASKGMAKLQSIVIDYLPNIAVGAPLLLKSLLRIVLVPIITFYLLSDKEKIFRIISDIVPEQKKAKFSALYKDIDRVNSEFVRGKIILAIFVGVMTTILLLVMGIEFALVIGIITCIADIIPYVGPFLGFTPAVTLAFFQSPIKALIVAVAFVVIQWAENNLLAPKILGSTIGMNPLLVLLCLIIGGGMFGFVGLIFSVPVVATLMTLYKHFSDDIKNFLKAEKIED